MKIKTSELSGAALDWAVTRANYEINFSAVWQNFRHECHYSTSWQDAGPIIEREGVLFTRTNDGEMYHAWIVRLNASATGPTHLTAAMRCFVASRLGDEVDVPEELI